MTWRLSIRRFRFSAAQRRRMHLSGGAPKVSDPEVRRFVDRALALGMSYQEIALACLHNFGKARAPGKSAIGRYWQTLKELKRRQRRRTKNRARRA
jgi:hypothetical protein